MLDPGTQLGRYEIQRRLGRGGMGAVYVAHDPVLGRMVAIKVFSGELELPEAHERFSREARAAAALSHPNIVTVYDFGDYQSQPYIVMEYVPGETLGQMIRRKAPASLLDKVRWMEELCAGVGYAHEMSMMHRDIKPSNLIIDRSGRLKILDFGIARVMGTASNTTGIVGTPGYMAPEQILDGPVDYRADLFSVGVVFYELLVYKEAFPGETMAAIAHRIVTVDPAPLATVARDVPPDVIAIVERLLRKVPSDRFSDAASIRAAAGRIRRRLESDSHTLDARTLLRPPRIPQASAKGDTPPTARTPSPRKTDREALARRRQEQLQAALEQARALLAGNDLEGAYEACQQALTFDEQNPEGLALEEAIEAAFAAAESDPTNVVAAEVSHPVPTPLADAAGSLADPPTVVTADGRASVGSSREDLAATRFAPRRTPPPTAAVVLPPAPETSASLPSAPSTQVIQPAPKTPASQPWWTQAQELARSILERLKAVRPDPAVMLAWFRSPRQYVMLAVGALAVAVTAIAVIVLMAVRPAQVGTVIIDAVPWGTITSIHMANREQMEVPSQAATPISLQLPPGDYQVVVVGPPPESQEQRLTVRVDSDATSIAPTVKFHVVTPADYFEPYLATTSLEAELNSEGNETANSPSSSVADSSASTGLRP
jgi:serine/threonine protein kinase